MIVKYKCDCCEERDVQVPDRVPESDIKTYMNVVAHCISYDHRARSRDCPRTKMEYAKIPMDNPDGIGIPVTLN